MLQAIKDRNIIRKTVIFFTSLSVLFLSIFYQPLNVYASNNEGWTTSQKVTYYASNFAGFITQFTGAIFNPSLVSKVQERVNSIALAEDYFGQSTYDDWVASCLGYSGSGEPSSLEDISVNMNMINAIKDATDYVIHNDTGFQYVYSYNGAQFLNLFNTQEHFHAFLEILESGDNYYIGYSPSRDLIVLLQADGAFITAGEQLAARPDIEPTYNWNETVNYRVYEWDSSNNNYVIYSEGTSSGYSLTSRKDLSNNPNFGYSYFYLIDLNTTQYLVYNSLNSLKAGSEGVQEYYIKDSLNTTHVDNSQTITKNQIDNSIRYNNVENYVNNYYVNNTTYPSSNDVYNYINNYDGSGGSGSGGSGSDDDDDDGWDWGFLDTIAGFLKGLLKALKTALEGVLDLLTGVIDLFIGEEQPDGSRSGGLPTIIGKLIAYFMPFLPEWCTQLIGFSVLLALILGVIKLVRGH